MFLHSSLEPGLSGSSGLSAKRSHDVRIAAALCLAMRKFSQNLRTSKSGGLITESRWGCLKTGLCREARLTSSVAQFPSFNPSPRRDTSRLSITLSFGLFACNDASQARNCHFPFSLNKIKCGIWFHLYVVLSCEIIRDYFCPMNFSLN